jgi:hypothetical protein
MRTVIVGACPVVLDVGQPGWRRGSRSVATSSGSGLKRGAGTPALAGTRGATDGRGGSLTGGEAVAPGRGAAKLVASDPR